MYKTTLELEKVVRRRSWRYILIFCAIALLFLCFYPVPISQNERDFKPFWKLVMR